MSFSASSASRNSICAITRLATSSSIALPRKTIRSRSSREKMSKARSPRWLCSITYGIRGMSLLSPDRVTGPRRRGSRNPLFRGRETPVVARAAAPELRSVQERARSGRRAGGARCGLSALTVRRFFDFSLLGEARKHPLVAQLDAYAGLERALVQAAAQARDRGAALARHLLDPRLDLCGLDRDRLALRERLEEQRRAHVALRARP